MEDYQTAHTQDGDGSDLCVWGVTWADGTSQTGYILRHDHFKFKHEGSTPIGPVGIPHRSLEKLFSLNMHHAFRKIQPLGTLFVQPPVFVAVPPLPESILQGRCAYAPHSLSHIIGTGLIRMRWVWSEVDMALEWGVRGKRDWENRYKDSWEDVGFNLRLFKMKDENGDDDVEEKDAISIELAFKSQIYNAVGEIRITFLIWVLNGPTGKSYEATCRIDAYDLCRHRYQQNLIPAAAAASSLSLSLSSSSSTSELRDYVRSYLVPGHSSFLIYASEVPLRT